MTIKNIVEVSGKSKMGLEAAIEDAVREVSKLFINVNTLHLKDVKVHLQKGKIESYEVTCDLSFSREKKETFQGQNMVNYQK